MTLKNLQLTGFLTFIFATNFIQAQPANFSSRGIGGGGALFFPTINPADDDEYYISCDMSELFHSTDFGKNYSQIHFTSLQVFNRSTYEFTQDSTLAYSIHNDGNTGYPVKTTDGGTTWNALPGNPDPSEEVYTLRADYSHPSRIVMGYYGYIYFSADSGNNFDTVYVATNFGVGIRIAGVFFAGDSIFIGTNEGVIYSVNAGTSFNLLSTTGITGTENILAFAGAQASATTRFFALTCNSLDMYNGLMPWDYWGLVTGAYSLDFGTNTWTSVANGLSFSDDFLMYAGMAWNDINTIYFAGARSSTNAPNVVKSTDAGLTWTHIFQDAGNANITTGWSGSGGDRGWSYGETCFGIAVAPYNKDKVVFGDFGFVHLTTDGGSNWKQAYVSTADENPAGASTPKYQSYHGIGLENTTCWQVHWQDSLNMFSCFSDIRGIRSSDGGASWNFDYTNYSSNSTYRIVQHPVSGILFAGSSNIHDMYQSTRLTDAILDANDANGKIVYSTDGGGTWQDLKVFNHPVFWLAFDPNDANTMCASVIHYGGGTGMGGIWRTKDLSNLTTANWTQLSAPPRTEGHPAAIEVLDDGNVVCTFSGRRNGSNAFTASSGVFIYDTTAGTWSDVSDPGMHYWTKDIVIDPADSAQNTWYACVFSGWGGPPNGLGGLYRTTNRGTSWTKLTGSTFDRVTSITFHPDNADIAYLTTETQGLWYSVNISDAFPVWTLVTSYDFRQPERVFFNPYDHDEVWVTSFGNGMKVGSTKLVGSDEEKISCEEILVWPNPVSTILNIRLPEGKVRGNLVSLFDLSGKRIVEWDAAEGLNVEFLEAGLYVVKAGNWVRKVMVWDWSAVAESR